MARLVKSIFQIGGGNNIDTAGRCNIEPEFDVNFVCDPFSLTNEQILDLICPTHKVDIDTYKFDVDSLVTLVDNILMRSTQVVDNENGSSREVIDEKIPQASFTSPLCILKRISYQMCCKDPGEEIAHSTTLEILKKLPRYSWVAKAVLTFGAFAHEYGELWLLSRYQPTEPLAKSLATLKRVPEFTLQKHRKDILELNNLLKDAWEVIKLASEIDKIHHLTLDAKVDVPDLETALRQIPVDVYWSIITITTIATQIECLTADSEEKQDLSPYGQKIKPILKTLKALMSSCKQYLDEAKYYQMLSQIFQTPTEIMEVFKVLIFGKDIPQAPIYDGDTKVSIEVLKKKNMFLFISTLDITEEEISILKPIHEHIKKQENQYTIVWVPIVKENWNDQLREKFYSLKSKMSWYVLEHFETIKGIKYIEEQWRFEKKPMVVVLNNQGKILHNNAFHMIQVCRLKGFPFTEEIEVRIAGDESLFWIEKLLIQINVQQLNDWIKKEETFILCGGKDIWIEQFRKCAGDQINLFCFDNSEEKIISNFWTQVESLFVAMMNTKSTTVTQQIQKLLSYKHESGWALLIRGSTVVLVANGNIILEIVENEEFQEESTHGGFVTAITVHHDRKVAAKTRAGCSHFEIPLVAGKIPQSIQCPECKCFMEVFISYKCCHKKANGEYNFVAHLEEKNESITNFVRLEGKESIANFVAIAGKESIITNYREL